MYVDKVFRLNVYKFKILELIISVVYLLFEWKKKKKTRKKFMFNILILRTLSKRTLILNALFSTSFYSTN